MAIRAVVFDIGGVLEIIDDSQFPGLTESRLGLAAGALLAHADELGANAEIGEVTEVEVRAHWQSCLALDDRQADELMADFWRWYVGTLDVPLRLPSPSAGRRIGESRLRPCGSRRRRRTTPGQCARGPARGH